MATLRPLELERRLRWLLVVRLGVAVCGMASLLLTHAAAGALQFPLYVAAAYYTLLAGCAINLVYLAILRSFRNHLLLAWIQILADIVLESLLVYFTGVDSVFAYLYFASVIAAAMILSRRASLLVASLATILLATAFIVQFLQASSGPLPLHLDGPIPRSFTDLDALLVHVFFFALSLHLVALLAGRLAAEVRRVRILHDEILQAMGDGVVTVDRDGQVAFVNRPARRLLGLPAGERIEGTAVEALRAEPVVRALLETLHTGRPVETETRIERPDGPAAPLDLHTSVLEDSEAHLRGVSVILHDATLREAVAEMEKRAERLRALADLGAAMAHEIRNPLASIRGAAQALHAEHDVRAESERLLDVIIRESDRLETLVDNFLKFARHRPPALAAVEIRDLMLDVASLLRSRPDAGSVTIAVEADGAGRWRCDADQMKQVLLNLGLNALEAFAEQKGPGQTLMLRARQLENPPRLWLEVDDNGPGISPSHWDQIFVPFFSTKPRGTGLGLAITKRIVEAHGGEIRFDTEPGKGTRFRIEIPD
jgi:two-component system sensor histidine kinase PilS (NtrC family)